MSIKILVIDDQVGKYRLEQEGYKKFVSGITEQDGNTPLVMFTFCPGQRERKHGHWVNDVKVALEALGDAKQWALVFVDVQFDCAVRGTTPFGETLADTLRNISSDLPIVLLTNLEGNKLQMSRPDIGYMPKEDLGEKGIVDILLTRGRVAPQDKRALLKLAPEVQANSPAMLDFFVAAFKAAQSDAPILLTGETGVGKSFCAELIHKRSRKKEGPFLEVNCAEIPETLIDSTLFGYERGSFTGAVGRQAGKIETADGGTLFLDEIGELPLAAQVKFLGVLQSKRITRVGGTQSQSVDFRLISATNRDLLAMMADKTFRDDLFYRFAAVPFTIPPLRERKEDIAPLAAFFLAKAAAENNRRGLTFSAEALAVLENMPHEGNVRALEKRMVRLAQTLNNKEDVKPHHIHKIWSDAFSTESTAPQPYFVPGAVPVPSTPPSGTEPRQPAALGVLSEDATPPNMTLNRLIECIESYYPPEGDEDLAGAYIRLDEAMLGLCRRLMGVALRRASCGGDVVLLRAWRYLMNYPADKKSTNDSTKAAGVIAKLCGSNLFFSPRRKEGNKKDQGALDKEAIRLLAKKW